MNAHSSSIHNHLKNTMICERSQAWESIYAMILFIWSSRTLKTNLWWYQNSRWLWNRGTDWKGVWGNFLGCWKYFISWLNSWLCRYIHCQNSWNCSHLTSVISLDVKFTWVKKNYLIYISVRKLLLDLRKLNCEMVFDTHILLEIQSIFNFCFDGQNCWKSPFVDS